MGKKYDEYGFRINPTKKKTTTKDEEASRVRGIIYVIIIVFVILLCVFGCSISGYIAWNCYANNLKPIRVIKTILATVFSFDGS